MWLLLSRETLVYSLIRLTNNSASDIRKPVLVNVEESTTSYFVRPSGAPIFINYIELGSHGPLKDRCCKPIPQPRDSTDLIDGRSLRRRRT